MTVARARTARVARVEARRACRAAVDALPLEGTSRTTVGDAAARRPEVAAALDEAVERGVREAEVMTLADGGTGLEVEVPLERLLAAVRAPGGARSAAGEGRP